jgi:hypothetical protein
MNLYGIRGATTRIYFGRYRIFFAKETCHQNLLVRIISTKFQNVRNEFS